MKACLPCFDDFWRAPDASHLLPPTGMMMNRNPVPPTRSYAGAAPAMPHKHCAASARPPRRRALLIGINYFGTDAELHGCINDVLSMRAFLHQQKFPPTAESMRVLTDHARPPHHFPTKANMLEGMRWLVEGAQPGDVLFFHFSGHGGQQVDTHGDEEDGMDETI